MKSSNPFGDLPQAANPYAAPNDVTPERLASQALFLPAVFLLLASLFSALYMLMPLAMVLAPGGLWQEEGDEFIWASSLISYCIILLASVTCVVGAISMLRMQPKWLAWTGAILAMLPLLGPCMGLTIPLGIWALVILRRPEADASFRS